MIRPFLFLLLLACAGPLHAQAVLGEVEHRPRWHVRSQFAGFQGLVSAGGGIILARGVWRPGLMYGYAPPAGDRIRVHQVILRNDAVFRPRPRERPTWFSAAASLNLILEAGDHSYLRLPPQFPRGYYHPPQAHGTVGLGGRVSHLFSGGREIAFTTEFVALDTYLWYGISQKGVPLHQAFGLSFGVAAAF
jgi:hypothetical protein